MKKLFIILSILIYFQSFGNTQEVAILFQKVELKNTSYLQFGTLDMRLADTIQPLSRQGHRKEAIKHLNKANELAIRKKEKSEVLYAFANHYALMKEKEKAMSSLYEAKKVYRPFNLCQANTDYDFTNLIGYQPFIDLIKKCN